MKKSKEKGITLIALIIIIVIAIIFLIAIFKKINKNEMNLQTQYSKSDIGKTVNYKPTQNTYTVSGVESGTNLDQTFTTEDLEWKIWNIENDKVYLTAVSSQSLQLASQTGYNNGNRIINNICSNIYQNTSHPEIIARSMTIEDYQKSTNIPNIVGYKFDERNYKSSFSNSISKEMVYRGLLTSSNNNTLYRGMVGLPNATGTIKESFSYMALDVTLFPKIASEFGIIIELPNG